MGVVIFPFEEQTEDLSLMPLAARRALDTAGLALSLEAWRSLDLVARETLVAAGAATVVVLEKVDTVCWLATPAPKRITAVADPEAMPSSVSTLLDDAGAELGRAWSTLTPLERYALAKLSQSQRRSPEELKKRLIVATQAILAKRSRLSHLTEAGEAHMVDVSKKETSARSATARGFIRLQAATLAALRSGKTPKGDVLATARIAGIQAAKRTPELIPLCHAIALTGVEVELRLESEPPGVAIEATARALDRTGVEMEALVAVSVAGLTLYDMLKSIDRGMTITAVELVSKSGGRSGDFRR